MPRSIHFIAFLACLTIGFQQQNKRNNNQEIFDVLQLSENLYMLRPDTRIGNPTTVISIGKDGVLMVDANLTEVGPSILNFIKQKGKEKIDFIFTTHAHGDHTQGLEYFGSNSVKISTTNQRNKLKTSVIGDNDPMSENGLPDITIDSTMKIYFNNEDILVSTFPNKNGHTNGDLFIYFSQSKVLCVGDYLFYDKFPIIDIGGGGDIDNYFKNIDYLLNTFPSDTKIIPGHSTFRPETPKYATMEEFKKQKDLLTESIDFIKGLMEQGLSAEQIIKKDLPQKFENYSKSLTYVKSSKWIKAIVNYYENKI